LDQTCQANQQRLITLANLHADFVRDACRRAGLQVGGRAIDVGCGPLGALAALAELVGPEGVVVGLDMSPETLAQARPLLDGLGLARVALVQADINAAEPATLPLPGPFDLAFCRCFLIHQTDPAATLRRIAPLVRPGGAIVVHELLDDERYPAFDPPAPACERFYGLLTALLRARGVSPDAGRRFEAICAAAGVRLVGQRGFFSPIASTVQLDFARAGLASVRERLVAAGLATEAEVERLDRELEAAKAVDYRGCFGSLFVEMIAEVA
jgi:SAM-dependent methyltransferase